MNEIIEIIKELQEIRAFIKSELEKFEFKQYINRHSLVSCMVKEIQSLLEYIHRDIQTMIHYITKKSNKAVILNLYQEWNSQKQYKVVELSQEVNKSKHTEETKLFMGNCVAFSTLVFERLERVFIDFENHYDAYVV